MRRIFSVLLLVPVLAGCGSDPQDPGLQAADPEPELLQMVALTAASLKMQFMSNNAATSQNSVAESLNAVARKQ